MDETGWREAKCKAWLWTALSGDVVTFAIRRGRGREVVNEILGNDFAGILNSDRWAVLDYLVDAATAHRIGPSP